MVTPTRNIPTVLVAYGATGDLMRIKVVPALFHLYKQKELPDMFRVFGFSRRDLNDEQFRVYVREMLEKHEGGPVPDEVAGPFLSLFRFQRGEFGERASYETLKKTVADLDREWGVCANKLFYLAVAPEFYETIFGHLHASGLTDPCSPEEGWTRVIVEKPFGTDSATAKKLDMALGALFKEEQIYRIDHYLAKEMLQNILAFRFSNNLFELGWGRELIERIHIRALESIGVEKRGAFYDVVGAFRDVGQNHFLQMLALVTMAHPVTFDARVIQKRRAEILEALRVMTPEEAQRATFRAQYEGYRSIQGVAPDSTTETYFKVRTSLAHPEWEGVPIILEGGKRLGPAQKDIRITFKHPAPCLCPPTGPHHTNEVVIRMEPKEEIQIEFWSKKPGFAMATEPRMFHFLFREQSGKMQYIEEYAKLLLDCIRGDQTLFVSTEEVQAMWRFSDSVVSAWKDGAVPLETYAPDTTEILARSAHIDTGAPRETLKKELALIGLGKMGGGIARRLQKSGWTVSAFDAGQEVRAKFEAEGISVFPSVKECVADLSHPRLVWLMVPAGKAVDEVLFGTDGLAELLNKGDIIIDGGNSFYKDSAERVKRLAKKSITFVDVGFSGGPGGARDGASLMVGGDVETFQKLEPLFYALATKGGYQFFPGAGAGHFVKMIHNGIEYGMMQALAEGFALLKHSDYKLDLSDVADIYNHGSVIESRLTEWLTRAFQMHGENLGDVSGSVGHTGEGEWTVKTAAEFGIKAKVIEDALQFRKDSEQDPSYTGKVLSALREQFGGHSIK
jgi:glucose-6-phosphate 1-dehydrogenase